MVKLSRIAPELPVANLKASIVYYEQKLGFRVAMQMPGVDYAIVERDDVSIHLFQVDARSSSPVGIHVFTKISRHSMLNFGSVALVFRKGYNASPGGIAIFA